MVGRTSSSDGRPTARGAARASVFFGLLGLAAFPVGWAVQKYLEEVSLLWAALAAIPAAIFGFVALRLARRVRERSALSLGSVAGAGTARVGRVLGFLAVYGAFTVGLAMAFYAVLATFGD